VALGAVAAAVAATRSAGLPLRDPDSISAARFVSAAVVVALAVALDVTVRAIRRSGRRRPSRAMLARVRRERWPGDRIAVVAAALASFYVTYFAYRNVKSVAPLLRDGESFDRRLLDLERGVLGGADPAGLVHDVLGTGASAHVLSAVYMAFFALIPLALAVALVLARDQRLGLFVVTALAVNWVLAAGSYLVLPSIGPFQADPATFAGLPHTAVTDMQAELMAKRTAFLADPQAAGAAQSIGAFASLHTSILLTAALAGQLLRAPRVLRVALWTVALLTMLATVYFGWHYLVDDVAGAAIAVLSLVAARLLTGADLGLLRRRVPIPTAAPEAA
jgi:membrane-associated phospholipid phosphatase